MTTECVFPARAGGAAKPTGNGRLRKISSLIMTAKVDASISGALKSDTGLACPPAAWWQSLLLHL